MESDRSITSQGTELSSMAPKVVGAINSDTFFRHPKRLSRIRRWNIVKLVFYTLCFGIALSIVTMDLYVWSYMFYFSLGNPYQLSLPFALASAIWCAAELITITVRRDIGRGIRPGWHVGVGLLLWLECFIISITTMISADRSFSYYMHATSDYGTIKLLQGGGTIVMILFVFLGVFHFGLFVRACIEVDHAKSERHIARVFEEITQLNLQGGAQTPTAPAQQQQQQQQPPQTQDNTHDATTMQSQEATTVAQPQIPRRPVGAPPADIRDKDSGACRIIDPEVEANLKFIAPFPIYASQGNLKYPQTVMKG